MIFKGSIFTLKTDTVACKCSTRITINHRQGWPLWLDVFLPRLQQPQWPDSHYWWFCVLTSSWTYCSLLLRFVREFAQQIQRNFIPLAICAIRASAASIDLLALGSSISVSTEISLQPIPENSKTCVRTHAWTDSGRARRRSIVWLLSSHLGS